jgi:hypothetical protein
MKQAINEADKEATRSSIATKNLADEQNYQQVKKSQQKLRLV